MKSNIKLFTKTENVVKAFSAKSILDERKIILQPLIDFVQTKLDANQSIRLNFICTHNSRRSHLSQIWAQTAASYYNINNVFCYSGGTETTALFPKVIETLQSSGFKIKSLSEGENPVYAIKYSENEHPVIGFSKTFDDVFNPNSDYAAIMTCSHADENCPIVDGAEKRIPITYDDPKEFDNTSEQSAKYNERSLQIASEMFYIFSKINNN